MIQFDSPAGTSDDAPIANWIRLIRAEYLEIPGLHLTQPQAQRLWGLDAATCSRVLEALQASRFLTRTARNGYILARH